MSKRGRIQLKVSSAVSLLLSSIVGVISDVDNVGGADVDANVDDANCGCGDGDCGAKCDASLLLFADCCRDGIVMGAMSCCADS